jgi:hypothetical protein
VFFLGTRSERDAAIKAWQQWWEANKEVSPELWLQKALDPAFETIAGNANGRPVGLAAEKIRVTFGTDFDIGNLVYSSAAFAPELAAARSIAGAWWTQHRAEPLTQLKRSAANVATIFKPAVAYQSFIAGNKLQEQVHLDAPHTGGLATGLPEIDRIVARAASGDPVAQAAAAPALRSALGTDFGLESFLSCPDFKDAARAATEVLADWWGYYKHRPVTEINESVASYETILQLSRRHVDMVRDELGKNPKPPGPTTKASGI